MKKTTKLVGLMLGVAMLVGPVAANADETAADAADPTTVSQNSSAIRVNGNDAAKVSQDSSSAAGDLQPGSDADKADTQAKDGNVQNESASLQKSSNQETPESSSSSSALAQSPSAPSAQGECSASDAASGMWGDAPWELCDGTLTVSRGVVTGWGSGAIGNSGGGSVANHPWDNNAVKSIVIEPGVLLNSDSGWAFASMPNLEHISGLDSVDVRYARSLWGLFRDDPKLQSVDFGSNNLILNAQFISYMFAGDTSLTSLDLSALKVSQNYGATVSADNMFLNCSNLRSVTGLNTMAPSGYGKIDNLDSLFKGASSLQSLDLSGFDASSVSSTADMFNGDVALTTLNLDGFDTSNVNWMGRMFLNCQNLGSIPIAHFDTRNVRDMTSMFDGCQKVENLDVSSLDTTNVTSMGYMFNECNSLKKITGLNHFNTSAVDDMRMMFNDCFNIEHLDVSGFDTANVTMMQYMFRFNSDATNPNAITVLDVSNFNMDRVANASAMFAQDRTLTTLTMPASASPVLSDASVMFFGDGKLEALDLRNLNTVSANTGSMFAGATALARLDLGPNTLIKSGAFNGTNPPLDDATSGEWVKVSASAGDRVRCADADDNLYQVKNAAWSSCATNPTPGQQASQVLEAYASSSHPGTYIWGQRATVKMKNVDPTQPAGDANVAVDHVYGVKVDDAFVYDASGNASTVSVSNFADYTIAGAPDHDGNSYVFNGWNTKEDGSGTAYQAGDRMPVTPGANLLYARWGGIGHYTVQFDANAPSGTSATGSMSATSFDIIDHDGTVDVQHNSWPVPRSDFAVDGYIFTGWTTDAAGAGHLYTPGHQVPLTPGTTTLYAQWKVSRATYTVKYEANAPQGSQASGDVADDSFEVHIVDPAADALHHDRLVVANAYSVSGYEFKGWNTLADGSGTTYQPGDTITLNAGTTKLYAHWQKITVPASGGNGTGSGGNGNGSGSVPGEGGSGSGNNGGSGSNSGSGNGSNGSGASNGSTGTGNNSTTSGSGNGSNGSGSVAGNTANGNNASNGSNANTSDSATDSNNSNGSTNTNGTGATTAGNGQTVAVQVPALTVAAAPVASSVAPLALPASVAVAAAPTVGASATAVTTATPAIAAALTARAATPLQATPTVPAAPVAPAEPNQDNVIPAPTTPRNRTKQCVSATEQSAYAVSWLEPAASAAPLCSEPSSAPAHAQLSMADWWWIVLIAAIAVLAIVAYRRYVAQSETVAHHRDQTE